MRVRNSFERRVKMFKQCGKKKNGQKRDWSENHRQIRLIIPPQTLISIGRSGILSPSNDISEE